MNNEVIAYEYPDNVRLRYGMYIGDGANPDVIFREVIDNSIDELYNSGPCDKVQIITENKYLIVIDNGRGIPLMNSLVIDPETGEYITQAKLAVSKLHSGSKFNKVSMNTGMNGVGVSCTNALSSHFMVIVKLSKYSNYSDKIVSLLRTYKITKNTCYYLYYQKGRLVEESLKELPEVLSSLNLDNIKCKDVSTLTAFIPDETIIASNTVTLPNLTYIPYIVKNKLNKDIEILINNVKYQDLFLPYHYQLKVRLESPNSKNPEVDLYISFKINSNHYVAEMFSGSVNGLVVNNGVHKNWVTRAYKEAFRETYGNLKGYEGYGVEINAIILANEPSFSSQTKSHLTQIEGVNYSHFRVVIDSLKSIFKRNNEVFKSHYQDLVLYISTIEDLSKKQIIESKVTLASQTSKSFIPRKLIECTTKDRSIAELYIVEGHSAESSLKRARNPKIHAILPVQGKCKNTSTMDILNVLNNVEMYNIVAALGVGVEGYNDISGLRYSKIIISCDEDPDGKNIMALLLGFFATHMKFLIDEGFLYVTKNPLYAQGGKYFFNTEKHKLDYTKPFTRFKGLGECNPDQLSDFMLNPDRRQLYRVNLTDADKALALLKTPIAKRQELIAKGIFKLNERVVINHAE